MPAIRRCSDLAVDLGAIKSQFSASQIGSTEAKKQQARNRRIARETPDYDITQDFGNLGPKYGIWSLFH